MLNSYSTLQFLSISRVGSFEDLVNPANQRAIAKGQEGAFLPIPYLDQENGLAGRMIPVEQGI